MNIEAQLAHSIWIWCNANDSLPNNEAMEQLNASHSVFTKIGGPSTLATKDCQEDDIKTSATIGSWALVQFEEKGRSSVCWTNNVIGKQ